MPNRQNGYTVVELLIVLGIITIVAGLGLFLSADTYRSSNFSAGVDAVTVSLQRARSRAINNIDAKRHGVKITGGDYVIFTTDNNYTGRDATKDEIIAGGAGFVFSGADEFVFDRLSGKTTAGDVTVTAGGKTATISINSQGRIN